MANYGSPEQFDRNERNLLKKNYQLPTTRTTGDKVLEKLSGSDKEKLKMWQDEVKFTTATLEGKRKIREEEAERLKLMIQQSEAQLKIAKQNNASKKDLLKIEKDIATMQSQYTSKMEDVYRMQTELNRAAKENVSLREKAAVIERQMNNYTRERKKLQKEIDEEKRRAREVADEKLKALKNEPDNEERWHAELQIESDLLVALGDIDEKFKPLVEQLEKNNPFNS